ncbi:unnamed protein product [Polarella glacialis]|uniref:Uncharacterized protein n=1 Tax=Polarella glacialis TaxID=89957 RepID=A0A813FBE8_POLGL|nr:unnamed protein product [Polarella glacialis]
MCGIVLDQAPVGPVAICYIVTVKAPVGVTKAKGRRQAWLATCTRGKMAACWSTLQRTPLAYVCKVLSIQGGFAQPVNRKTYKIAQTPGSNNNNYIIINNNNYYRNMKGRSPAGTL